MTLCTLGLKPEVTRYQAVMITEVVNIIDMCMKGNKMQYYLIRETKY